MSLNYQKVNKVIEDPQINKKVDIIDVHWHIKLCTWTIKNTPAVQVLWIFMKIDNILGPKEPHNSKIVHLIKIIIFIHNPKTRHNKIRDQ